MRDSLTGLPYAQATRDDAPAMHGWWGASRIRQVTQWTFRFGSMAMKTGPHIDEYNLVCPGLSHISSPISIHERHNSSAV